MSKEGYICDLIAGLFPFIFFIIVGIIAVKISRAEDARLQQ